MISEKCNFNWDKQTSWTAKQCIDKLQLMMVKLKIFQL